MQFVKVLHDFKKFEEFERLHGRQPCLLQMGDASPLKGKMASPQFYMPSHHADVINKRHLGKRWHNRDVPLARPTSCGGLSK